MPIRAREIEEKISGDIVQMAGASNEEIREFLKAEYDVDDTLIDALLTTINLAGPTETAVLSILLGGIALEQIREEREAEKLIRAIRAELND
jgi:hypothetical protein